MSRRPRLTVDRALALFEANRQRAPSTIRLERRTLRHLLARLPRRLSRLGQEDVCRLLAERHEEVARNTVARELGTLRSFLDVLVAEGYLRTNPAAGLAARPGRERAPVVLSAEAVERMLAAALVEATMRRAPEVRRAVALRDRACLELLYGCGLRASEVAAVLVVDMSVLDGTLLVRRVKRGESSVVPLPPASLPHLTSYLDKGRPALARRGRDQGRLLVTERGTPLRLLQVERIVGKVAKRAGVRAHPHALRRAIATHLVRAGAHLPAVQALLGHVRLDTTQRYVVVDREDLRRAVEVLERDRS